MRKQVFEGTPEMAITEEDLKQALAEWLKARFDGYNSIGNYYKHTFEISDIKHCRSDSSFSLRFKVTQVGHD